MAVTPEIETEIMRAYSANPKRFSPFRVSKQVGATMSEVIAVVNRNKVPEGATFHGDVTRPELEKYIVASRQATDRGWNNEDHGVREARAGFEAGTHDMATHREGPWLHLCSIPLRRHRRPRPGYFTGKPL